MFRGGSAGEHVEDNSDAARLSEIVFRTRSDYGQLIRGK